MLTQNVVVIDKDILGGIPVFNGTRVPIQTLMDYLGKGYPLEEFLDDFPTVTLAQAQTVLAQMKQLFLEDAYARVA
jgi:uncharacterized protein (DUF433 family)